MLFQRVCLPYAYPRWQIQSSSYGGEGGRTGRGGLVWLKYTVSYSVSSFHWGWNHINCHALLECKASLSYDKNLYWKGFAVLLQLLVLFLLDFCGSSTDLRAFFHFSWAPCVQCVCFDRLHAHIIIKGSNWLPHFSFFSRMMSLVPSWASVSLLK